MTALVWYDDKGITLDTLPDLMQVAKSPQFGEGKRENLCRFLMCEAFERRNSPDDARAFHLAAMIISRIET